MCACVCVFVHVCARAFVRGRIAQVFSFVCMRVCGRVSVFARHRLRMLS